MSHLYKIGLENFRVFKDYTEIEFAPITILTGANNSGKSSVIKSLYLLKDNFSKSNPFDSPYLMKGKLNFLSESHKLGQFDLICNDLDKPVKFSIPTRMKGIGEGLMLTLHFGHDGSNDLGNAKLIDLSLHNTSHSKLIFRYFVTNKEGHFYVDYNYFFTQFDRLLVNQMKGKVNTVKSFMNENKGQTKDGLCYYPFPFIEFEQYGFLSKDLVNLKKDSGEEKILSCLNFVFFLMEKKLIDYKYFSIDLNASDPIVQYLKKFHNFDNKTINILIKEFNSSILKKLNELTESYSIKEIEIHDLNDNIPEILSHFFDFELAYDKFGLIEYLLEEAGLDHLKNLNEDMDTSDVRFHDVIYAIHENYSERDKLMAFLQTFMAQGLSEILDNASVYLNKLNSLDAVRANTQRLYTYKSQGTDFNELIHEFLDRNLNKDRNSMEFINKWLRCFGFSEGLIFDTSKQGIGNIIKIGNRSIADCGYGLTQFLPILIKIANVQEIAPEHKSILHTFTEIMMGLKGKRDIEDKDMTLGSTLIIEEPEANLHPKFQSLLADLFIDANKRFNIQFVIETHSEYLIRKLQYLTGKGDLNSTDTSIFYFHNPDSIPDGEKQVKRIHILNDGSLSSDFGTGFFDEALNWKFELLKLKNKN